MENRNTTLLGLLGGALLVIALAAGAFGGMAFTKPAPAQAQGSGVPGMRQVTVVGSGEAQLAQDVADVEELLSLDRLENGVELRSQL